MDRFMEVWDKIVAKFQEVINVLLYIFGVKEEKPEID